MQKSRNSLLKVFEISVWGLFLLLMVFVLFGYLNERSQVSSETTEDSSDEYDYPSLVPED